MREPIAAAVLIAIMPGIALGQQPAETPDQAPRVPATTVTERTYPDHGLMPWRRVQTRTEAAGRETVTETLTVPGINGGAQPIQEVVTETVRTGPDRTQSSRDVFTFDPQRRRTLAETTQSTRETLADATTRTVHETRVSDLSDRRVLTSRQIEETRSVGPNTFRTDMSLFRPGVNEPLQESERIERTERRIEPGVIESNETILVRDMNGRWQPTEKRSGEVRSVGTSERQVEETIQRPNVSGILTTNERVVTRHARVNGGDEVVIERYFQDVEGSVRSGGLGLGERIRRTTTATADGGHDTVEEVEARNPAAPGDPMRVVLRTVTTLRRIGPGRWATERRVFRLDVNGRLEPFAIDDEESVLK